MPLISRIVAGIFLLLATRVTAPGQSGQTYVLAMRGDHTPDGQDTIETPGSFALANTGAVFFAHLTNANVSALFSTTVAGKAEILRVGNNVPGAGTIFGLAGNLWMNRQAQAVVYAVVTDGNGANHDALLTGSMPANVRPVAVADQTVPDGYGQFGGFGAGTLNDAGHVAFWGSIKNGGGPLISTNGIFIGHPNGTLTEIVRSTQSAPGETNPFYSLGGPVLINSTGQACFTGEVNDAHFGTPYDSGVFRASSSLDMVKLARSYDPAPGTGFLLGNFTIGSINNAGAVSFFSYLIDSSGTFKGRGLFKSASSGPVTTIAYSGQTVSTALGQYTDFDNTLGINNAGHVAYVGYFAKGSTKGSGVFLGDGISQRLLVRNNQVAPGGATFTGFALARANDTGTVAFTAQLNKSSQYNGIFLTDGIETLKVAQVGDVVNGTPIYQLGFDPKAFNDLRQVAYQTLDSTGTDFRIYLFAPALKWRTNGDGNWDDAVNWTVSLVPATYNDVNVIPTTGGRVAGPAADVTVRSLTIGAGTSGSADFALRSGIVTVTNGVTVAPLGKLSGSGRLVGNVVNQATVGPGNSPGTITVQGNYTQASTVMLEVEIAGPAAASYDSLAITGNATLGGTLRLTPLGNALEQLSSTSSLEVVTTAGTITGAFSNAANGARVTTTDGLASFQVNYAAHSVVLSDFVAVDSDSDGLPDYWMQQYFGHIAHVAGDNSQATDDADGDGMTNIEEYVAGTDPTKATNAFRVALSFAGNTLSISFPTVLGRTYSIETSSQLDAPIWSPVVVAVAGDGTTRSISLGSPSPSDGPRFYHASVSR